MRTALEGSSMRIAAHIVGGIGFIGAGAIIQDRSGIHGITTAATIWLVASIGISCGAGFYLLAIIATTFAIITLSGLGPLGKKFTEHCNKVENILAYKILIQ
jgi:putative Mg2+ transporter-C (MgtC) family protein